MLPDVDATLSFALDRVLALTHAKIACAFVACRDAPMKERNIGISIRGVESLSEVRYLRQTLNQESDELLAILDKNERTVSSPQGIEIQQGKLPWSGQTIVLRLVKAEPLHLIVLAKQEGNSQQDARMQAAFRDLGHQCLSVVERHAINRASIVGDHDFQPIGISDAFRNLEAKLRRFASN